MYTSFSDDIRIFFLEGQYLLDIQYNPDKAFKIEDIDPFFLIRIRNDGFLGSFSAALNQTYDTFNRLNHRQTKKIHFFVPNFQFFFLPFSQHTDIRI